METADEFLSGQNDFYDSEDSDTASEDPASHGSGFFVNSFIHKISTYLECLQDSIPELNRLVETYKASTGWTWEDHKLNSFLSVPEPARPYCRIVSDKFPCASTDLVRRFGEANWERHQRLREYLTSTEELEVVDDSTYLFRDSGLGSSAPSALLNGLQKPQISSQIPRRANSRATFTSFITGRTLASDRGLQLPQSPPEALTGKPFKCEICQRIIKSIWSRTEWKYANLPAIS